MHDSRFLRRLVVGGALLVIGGIGLALALTGGKPANADEPAVRIKGAPQPAAAAPAGGHTMFGGTPNRNFVDLTSKFSAVQLMPVKEDDKVVKDADAVIKWQADLGSRAYGGPIIAGGKVFVGTNNERPRNMRDQVKNADGDVEPVD